MSTADSASEVPDAETVRTATQQVLDYLSTCDPVPQQAADAVLGFGVFDLRLPRFCAELYRRGLARKIIFTGGIGGGTGDLGGPEADVWREEIRRLYPDITDDAFILENRSTNTAENIQFTAALLATQHPELAFGRGLRTAIIVASPSRLRRAGLTLRHLQPEVRSLRQLPGTSLDAEQALYTRQGINYRTHLVGEIERLQEYPRRGWIMGEAISREILTATEILQRARPAAS